MLKVITALYILITASALIVLKLGSKHGAVAQFIDGKLDLNINPLSLLGIFLYGVSFLLYMFLISKFDLGYIIPLTTAFVYILVFVASFIVFKETFTALKVAGIALIIIGVALLNMKTTNG